MICVVLSIPTAARAQATDEPAPAIATVELRGGWGVQFGDTEYLPDGSATEFKYPFVSGWGAGASAGWLFARDLALIATYEYWTAESVEGNIPGAIDSVKGSISYHTAVLGMRMYRGLGPGRLRAEMGAGLAFPFETETKYDWAEELGAAGITGTGTHTDAYGMGVGVQGQLGYEVPVGGPAFVALGLQLRAFQSDNNGEKTTLDNVVTDFTTVPPVAVDATIEHGNGQAQPTTFSVQDLGLRLSVGARF